MLVRAIASTRNEVAQVGHVALDGTKIQANASKRKALSLAHTDEIEARSRQEVQTLLALVENTDRAGTLDGIEVPSAIDRREDRLDVIAQTKAKNE